MSKLEVDILEAKWGRVMWRGHGVSEWLDFLEIQAELAAQCTACGLVRELEQLLSSIHHKCHK